MRISATVAAAIAAALVGACAPTPESIQPAYVSETPYRSWTCDQLGEELTKLDQALATASMQQNTARTNDTVGVILLGLPVARCRGRALRRRLPSTKASTRPCGRRRSGMAARR